MKIISKVLAVFGRIPQDKLLHFIAGFLIVALCSLCKGFAPYAWSVAVLAAFCKEWYDSNHNGNVDSRDFVATMVGAFVMQWINWIDIIIH